MKIRSVWCLKRGQFVCFSAGSIEQLVLLCAAACKSGNVELCVVILFLWDKTQIARYWLLATLKWKIYNLERALNYNLHGKLQCHAQNGYSTILLLKFHFPIFWDNLLKFALITKVIMTRKAPFPMARHMLGQVWAVYK